ncbi:RING finger protein 37 [Aplochiton taeniatus]
MVVNVCLPHFKTTIQCNKLCADGYDVTNLLSADPAARRRGFKLEYFLRPPVQVTVQFEFRVEVCRVDVELWPWGMDRGQACKKLEISTSSDPVLSLTSSPNPDPGLTPKQGYQQDQTRNRNRGQRWTGQGSEKHPGQDSRKAKSRGHQWSTQAKQWDQQDLDQGQHFSQAKNCESKPQHGQAVNSQPEPEFRLVGRCELRDDTMVCFSHPRFCSRPPSDSPPRPPAEGCRQEELWSRGPLSLGSVTQLRVTVPYGGAASAQGLKALAVWGQPAHCCSAEELERVWRVHQASLRPPQQPSFGPPVSLSPQPPSAATTMSSSLPPVPEEFLDPLTQEVMSLPMLLPSGASVDNSTLEEFQKREASWGRAPNDPFTGVPFTASSQPLPNPLLKCRIDHFLLRTGADLREGTLGRHGGWENPHPSRLLPPWGDGEGPCPSTSAPQDVPCGTPPQDVPCGTPSQATQHEVGTRNVRWNQKQLTLPKETRVENGTENRTKRLNSQPERQQEPHTSHGGASLGKEKKIDFLLHDEASSARHPDELLAESKRRRVDAGNSSGPSRSSHEQRLSASLDEALLSALRGRPTYTTHTSQTSQPTHTAEVSAEACVLDPD